MTDSAGGTRKHSRRELFLQAYALAIVLLPVALLVMSGNPLRVRHLVEGAFVVGAVNVAWASGTVRQTFAAMLSWQKAAVAAAIAGIAAGQLVGMPERTYPLISWYMYASATPPQDFVHYRAVYESGQIAGLPLHEISPSSSPRAFLGRLNRVGNLRAATPDSARLSRLDEILTGLTAAYNERNPAASIRAVEVIRCSLPLMDGRAGAPECRPVLRSEVPAGLRAP
jgi:hypothetical protein